MDLTTLTDKIMRSTPEDWLYLCEPRTFDDILTLEADVAVQIRFPHVPPKQRNRFGALWLEKFPGKIATRTFGEVWYGGVHVWTEYMVAIEGPEGTSDSWDCVIPEPNPENLEFKRLGGRMALLLHAYRSHYSLNDVFAKIGAEAQRLDPPDSVGHPPLKPLKR